MRSLCRTRDMSVNGVPLSLNSSAASLSSLISELVKRCVQRSGLAL